MTRQATLHRAFRDVRTQTMALVTGLSGEDCMVQSMADASPVKWHLAHTTWFFETFVLERAVSTFIPFHPAYRMLFNSYYVGVGERLPRPERGVLSRPALDDVLVYRRHIDQQLDRAMASKELPPDLLDLIELGLHHEQQHQELILTDLKHHFSRNPLLPAYRNGIVIDRSRVPAQNAADFVGFAGGHGEIGRDGSSFAFDNERPRHGVWLVPFALATRPVSNREYLAFIDDAGYRRPELWLSDGWDTLCRERWTAPLYWNLRGSEWMNYTLHGEHPLQADEPVCHVSYYEADAYARWAGARLPDEAEWERAAQSTWQVEMVPQGNFLESTLFHPRAVSPVPGHVDQLFGDTWEWTRSAYLPYPGFRQAAGAVGEYNGKFMINQMVLRGGSCATPQSHIRPTYRNFFPPTARWQFSGIRLACDIS
jgi:ergothioneine biosynthesis protein EgtB